MDKIEWEIVDCTGCSTEFPFDFLAPPENIRLTSIFWDGNIGSTTGGDYITVPVFNLNDKEIKIIKEKLEQEFNRNLTKIKYESGQRSYFIEVKQGDKTGLAILI